MNQQWVDPYTADTLPVDLEKRAGKAVLGERNFLLLFNLLLLSISYTPFTYQSPIS